MRNICRRTFIGCCIGCNPLLPNFATQMFAKTNESSGNDCSEQKRLQGMRILAPEGQGFSLARDKGPDSLYGQSRPPILEGVRTWRGDISQIIDIDLGLGTHGMVASPDGRYAVFFEKWGQTSAVFDFKTGIAKKFASHPGAEFYGHGTISRDGSHMFVAESEIESGNGLVTIREVSSGKVMDVWKYRGLGLHDLAASPSEGVLLAPFSGRQISWVLDAPIPRGAVRKIDTSFLAVIDLKTGVLRERLTVEDDEISLTHITTDPENDRKFYIGTTPRDPPTIYGNSKVYEGKSKSLRPVFGQLGSGLKLAPVSEKIKDQLKMEM